MRLFRIFILALALMPSITYAQSVVLDQQVSFADPANAGVSGLIGENIPGWGSLWAGQTFTVGVDGTLNKIGFAAYDTSFSPLPESASIVVTLWKDFFGNYNPFGGGYDYGGATLLATKLIGKDELAANWSNDWFHQYADFSAFNLGVNVGDHLAFEVRGANGYTFGLAGQNLITPYPGGHSYGTNVGGRVNNLVFDTYVAVPSPVPLPATLPLMLSGLGILGFAARRKKLNS